MTPDPTSDRLPPVPLFTLFTRMGGWFVLVLGGMLLIFTAVGQGSFSAAQRFDREGLPATAQVTERYTTQSRDSDGDTTTTYWLTLDYVTQGGRDFTQTRSVGRSLYRSVTEGNEIEIRYLRSRPTRIEVEPGSHATGARVMQFLALLAGLIWLAGLWVVGRWTVEAARARRYGDTGEAKVTAVERSWMRINNSPRYRLLWRDANGHTGQSLLNKRGDLSSYDVGDPIRIYYGLKRSWWAGDIGDREG